MGLQIFCSILLSIHQGGVLFLSVSSKDFVLATPSRPSTTEERGHSWLKLARESHTL